MADAGANDSNQYDAALLHELATRLLSRLDPHDPDPGEVQLLPGRVPDEMRQAIPFPDDSRIVGSQVFHKSATVIFDTQLSRERLVAFYDEQLLEGGWSKPEPFDPFPQGGFSHSMFAGEWLHVQYYCRGPKDPYVSVHAFEKPDRPTAVRVDYVSDPRHSPCDLRQRSRMRLFTEEAYIIPRLSPPPNGLQTPKASQGHIQDYFGESIAYLKSSLDMGAIHAHYGSQLEKHGWHETESGGDSERAWSKYTFQDKEGEKWWGLLLATAFPTQWGESLLYVLARLEQAQEQFDDFLNGLGLGGGSGTITWGP